MLRKVPQIKPRFAWVRVAVMALAGLMFAVAAFQLVSYGVENARSRKQNQQLIDLAVVHREPQEAEIKVLPNGRPTLSGGTQSAVGQEDAAGQTVDPVAAALTASIPILVDFEALQAQNPDVVGWIYCEDTVINYPILQGEDNQYYVTHQADGSRNANGSIFMDFRNGSDLQDLNSILYGHNMNDGSMFGTLLQYKKQAYYEAHPVLWVMTPQRAYRVDLVAGVVARSDDLDTFCFYEDTQHMRDNLARQIEKSTFQSPITDPSGVEQLISFSTCSYEHATARFVLIGSMTPAEYPVHE